MTRSDWTSAVSLWVLIANEVAAQFLGMGPANILACSIAVCFMMSFDTSQEAPAVRRLLVWLGLRAPTMDDVVDRLVRGRSLGERE